MCGFSIRGCVYGRMKVLMCLVIICYITSSLYRPGSPSSPLHSSELAQVMKSLGDGGWVGGEGRGTQPSVSVTELCETKNETPNLGRVCAFFFVFGTLTVYLHSKKCVAT